MTDLLEKAFREAAKLSPEDQNRLANFILADLDSERRWDEAFEESQDALAELADQAEEEQKQGETQPLVPDEL